MKAKSVGAVYATCEYDGFRKLRGNRSIMENRKNMIKKSIAERGWIRNPIVVNEFMEIIDGQGRFEALKELGLPIEYVISDGASIDDCIALNLKQANWKIQDYIDCYADFGDENYAYLRQLIKKYNKLSPQTVIMAAGRFVSDGADTSKKVQNGAFKLHNIGNIQDRIEFIEECIHTVGRGNGRERHWAAAFKFVYHCREIDNTRFRERLKKHKLLIVPCVSTKACLENLEKLYNYGCKVKTYFPPLWDKYIAECKNSKSADEKV